ncbi:MAG: CHC2 zinc finger domain-containing protein [Rhodobacteraceae bacterium]|nr:CHC2 zinc finger domain-containing protein [Paracoccaceae bacterium]
MVSINKQYIEEITKRVPLQNLISHETGTKFKQTSDGYKGLCPFHKEKTPSFHIYGSEKQNFICFGSGCGVKGDALTFLMKWRNITFMEALEYAREWANMPEYVPLDYNQSVAVSSNRPHKDMQPWNHNPISKTIPIPKIGIPVTVYNPKKSMTSVNSPTHVHVYRDTNGAPLLLVLRFNRKDGGKYFFQVTWKSGGIKQLPNIKGCWTQFNFVPEIARPLYGLQDLKTWQKVQGQFILIVEGEKTRDAAAQMLPVNTLGILTISNLGSTGAVNKIDWLPLVEGIIEVTDTVESITFILWPDADEVITKPDGNTLDRQEKFVSCWKEAIIKAFDTHEIKIDAFFRQIFPGNERSPGWDLADASEEGWIKGDFTQWFYSCSKLIDKYPSD